MPAQDVPVGAELATLERLLQRTLGEHYVVQCHADPGIWHCVADPAQLESAMINLAINARDAMPTGGPVTIEAHNIHAEEGTPGGIKPGDYVMLTVTDTGGGIARAHIDRIFEPFFTTKDVGKGTGLGLSMVYGFVTSAKGHVSVDSELGKGTTVRIYLPRATAAPVPAPAPHRQAPNPDVPCGNGETLLIVEDQEDMRELTVRNARALGYTVLAAADGIEAEQILRREPHLDLLFSDVVLPGGRLGPDIAKIAVQCHPGLGVLYMSGYTGEALQDQQPNFDPGLLLRKPFRKRDMAQAIQKALRR